MHFNLNFSIMKPYCAAPACLLGLWELQIIAQYITLITVYAVAVVEPSQKRRA